MSSGVPVGPRRERRRGQQAVEPHGERRAVLRREERVELEHARACASAAAAPGRRACQVEAVPAVHEFSMRFDEQDVLAARERIGVDADEAEQAATRSPRSRRRRLDVGRVGRRLQRADDVERHAGGGAGRVDREVDRGPQRRDAARGRRPSRRGRPSTSAPAGRRSRRATTPAAWASPSLIHGWKSAGARSGNVRHRLVRSPFGSMSSAGTPAGRASSMSTTPRPVLPEPVMPTITPWVVRSAAGTATSCRCAGAWPGRRPRRGADLPCGRM